VVACREQFFLYFRTFSSKADAVPTLGSRNGGSGERTQTTHKARTWQPGTWTTGTGRLNARIRHQNLDSGF
jgi:hypothetical protein